MQLLEHPDVLQRYLERAALKDRWRALVAPVSADLAFNACDWPLNVSDAALAEPLVGLTGALQRGRVPSPVQLVYLCEQSRHVIMPLLLSARDWSTCAKPLSIATVFFDEARIFV
jgi:hypothetical protein